MTKSRVLKIRTQMWDGVLYQIRDMIESEFTEKEIKKIILRDVKECFDASFSKESKK